MRLCATTVLGIVRDGRAAIAADGQMTSGDTIVKTTARKIRVLGSGRVLAGFAGGASDALQLFERFEAALDAQRGNLTRAAVEVARLWRSDRMLRRLEAQLIVLDTEKAFALSGSGELFEPDDGILGIGAGGGYAIAVARALTRHTDLPVERIAEESLRSAAEICIYTGGTILVEIPAEAMSGTDPAALTPRQIVTELDRYVIGQESAKRAVAIALRNRYRRRQVSGEMREEILPNNILMIGPTGVGKTEIARRLARLAQAPFLKVEASKFTEVGYVGRDVESMVRDLVELGVGMARAAHSDEVRERVVGLVEQKLLGLLLPRRRPRSSSEESEADPGEGRRTRDRLREQLAAGELEDRDVEIETGSRASRPLSIFPGGGFDEIDVGLAEALESILPRKRKRRRMRIGEARDLLLQEETERLIDADQVVADGLERVQNHGIIFIDEIDKIAGSHAGSGPEVSRQGVQRDLLPILEGSSVATRYGMVRTDHILFIAAGAFHENDPSELIPELQGRLPIRVELQPLSEGDFVRILTEPRNALLKQYQALLATEGLDVAFEPDAVRKIAAIARDVNEMTENIGARRLHTVLTTLLEELLFEAPDGVAGRVTMTEERVEERLRPVLGNKDLSRFIL